MADGVSSLLEIGGAMFIQTIRTAICIALIAIGVGVATADTRYYDDIGGTNDV